MNPPYLTNHETNQFVAEMTGNTLNNNNLIIITSQFEKLHAGCNIIEYRMQIKE